MYSVRHKNTMNPFNPVVFRGINYGCKYFEKSHFPHVLSLMERQQVKKSVCLISTGSVGAVNEI